MSADNMHTATPGAERPTRRRNVDRSAATRRQILDATVTCLQKQGYGAVTNQVVAEAAGVSRGAMMHHFPTRQDLLVATAAYAHDKNITMRMAELSKLPVGLPRFRAVIELTWKSARTPEGLAINEIRVGSRSDPGFAAALTPLMTKISQDYGRFVGRIVREAGLEANEEIQGLSATTALALRGLAIDRYTNPSPAMVDYILHTLNGLREDIIARQLGEDVAQRPAPMEKPANAEKPPASAPAKTKSKAKK